MDWTIYWFDNYTKMISVDGYLGQVIIVDISEKTIIVYQEGME